MSSQHPYIRWLVFVSSILLVTWCIRTSIISVDSIVSGSMLPSYQVGTRIVSNQLSWGLNVPLMKQQIIQWKLPQRGEVVIFRNPHDDGNIWIKRVIGLPGDHIEFRHHQLYVNQHVCSFTHHNKERMPREKHQFSPSYRIWASYLEKDWGPIVVPAGELFLMGDNRGDSIDSRTWGSISIRYLVGKPWFRISYL